MEREIKTKKKGQTYLVDKLIRNINYTGIGKK
jgi:hypothetical protein